MPEDKLYCGNCQAELTPAAKACPKCGADPRKAVKFCTVCGEQITNPNAIICTKCGASLKGAPATKGSGGGLAPGEMDPIIATAISLFVPALGLFFIWPEDKRNYAILAAAGLLIFDGITAVGSIILMSVLIGFCCIFLIPVIHIVSAVYTYNEGMKATGGKTLF